MKRWGIVKDVAMFCATLAVVLAFVYAILFAAMGTPEVVANVMDRF